MKFYMVCTMSDTATGGTYDAKLYPYDDTTRAVQRTAAVAEGQDAGWKVYRVTDNAPTVERALPVAPVYLDMDMRGAKALRDWARDNGFGELQAQVQAAIDIAKAA